MSDEDTPGIVIPIIPLDNTVVFPGDSVPLRVFPPSLLRSSSVGQVNMVVGVVCQSDEGLASIGTMVQLRTVRPTRAGVAPFVTATARETFELDRLEVDSPRCLLGVVHKRSIREGLITPPVSSGAPDYLPWVRNRRIPGLPPHHYHAIGSHIPNWAYRRLDPPRLCARVARVCASFDLLPPAVCASVPGALSSLPPPAADPTQLALYIARNLPAATSARQSLLECRNTSLRLCLELSLLSSLVLIRCSSCLATLANYTHMFRMGDAGTMGIFVNPGGFLHQTITLRQVAKRSLRLSRGPPCLEHTWFKGYGWTIANCRGCGTHIGWQYDRMVESGGGEEEGAGEGSTLARFWGFRRDAIAYKSSPPSSPSSSPRGSGTEQYTDSDHDDDEEEEEEEDDDEVGTEEEED